MRNLILLQVSTIMVSGGNYLLAEDANSNRPPSNFCFCCIIGPFPLSSVIVGPILMPVHQNL